MSCMSCMSWYLMYAIYTVGLDHHKLCFTIATGLLTTARYELCCATKPSIFTDSLRSFTEIRKFGKGVGQRLGLGKATGKGL